MSSRRLVGGKASNRAQLMKFQIVFLRQIHDARHCRQLNALRKPAKPSAACRLVSAPEIAASAHAADRGSASTQTPHAEQHQAAPRTPRETAAATAQPKNQVRRHDGPRDERRRLIEIIHQDSASNRTRATPSPRCAARRLQKRPMNFCTQYPGEIARHRKTE